MGNVVLGTKAGHLLADEISSVVRDDSVGNSEAAYYVLPVELHNLLPADLREWYCLESFWLPVGNVTGAVLGRAVRLHPVPIA